MFCFLYNFFHHSTFRLPKCANDRLLSRKWKRFQRSWFSSSDYCGWNIGDKRLDKQIISLPDDFSLTFVYSTLPTIVKTIITISLIYGKIHWIWLELLIFRVTNYLYCKFKLYIDRSLCYYIIINTTSVFKYKISIFLKIIEFVDVFEKR